MNSTLNKGDQAASYRLQATSPSCKHQKPAACSLQLVAFLCTLSFVAVAQKEIVSFKFEIEIASAYVDRADDFYLMLASGEIQKFDKDGKKIASLKEPKLVTAFEPSSAMRLLTYTQFNQHYSWLSPTLESRGYEQLDSSWAIEPVLICPSGDFNLWILDAADWSLRKINPGQSLVLAEFALGTNLPQPKIKLMREYLGFLFILDQDQGILVFNSIGKLIRKFEGNISWFNFLGEELYYPMNNALNFFDLYTTETRQLAISPDSKFVLLTDERMVVVSKSNRVSFHSYKP